MPSSPAARKLLAEAELTARRRQRLRPARAGAETRRARRWSSAPPRHCATASASPRRRRRPARRCAKDDASREERVRMTRLRQTIAKRLKEAQDSAAMLTTFNDVDMSAVMQLRKDYREAFEKKHGVKLGFMGFFVKAAVAGAEGHPRGQCRDRRRGHRLQELLSHRRRRRHRARPGRAGAARRRPHEPRRDREHDRRFRRARARRQARAGGDARRHLHHLQWRHLRLAAVDADPQRAAIGHSRHAPDRGARRWCATARSWRGR